MTDLSGVRILLTGATGRVGARFLPLLSRAGARVRLAVWVPRGAAGGRNTDSMVMGDLCDPGTCRRAVEGVDAVVHIASAFQGVTAAEAYAVNHGATAALTTAARHAGVRRFVQMSSYLVYRPDPERPAREDDEPRALGRATFPAAKLGAERAVREAADAGLGVCVLRVGFTYGEGDPHLADAFAWAHGCADDRRLHLIHHADVRQGVLLALRAGDLPGRVYNLADDSPMCAARLRTLADGFRWQGDPEAWTQLAEEEDVDGLIDTTAVRRDLDFRPTYPSIMDAEAAGQM